MKRIELDAIFTAKVNEYISNGYAFNTNTMGGSQGEIAHVDLRKGDEIIRILMDSEYDIDDGKTIRIVVGRSPRAIPPEITNATIWNNQLEIIEEIVFLEVSRNWFTSVEENDGISDLRFNRRQSQRVDKTYTLTPTVAFIRNLKKRKGFSNATRSNVTIERSEYGYNIKLIARDGHISRTETIRFKNTK